MVKQNIFHGKEHEEELLFSFVLFAVLCGSHSRAATRTNQSASAIQHDPEKAEAAIPSGRIP